MEYGKNSTGIELYLKTLPVLYDKNKRISLYKAIEKYNPKLINELNSKIYIKKNFITIRKEKKWYENIIKYLIQINVINEKIEKDSIYHQISEDYKKYFINSESMVFIKENYNEHLYIYKEGVEEFLKNTSLLPNENEKIKNKKEIPDNVRRILQYIGGGFIIISMIIFLNFFVKFGKNDALIILLNSAMFIVGFLLNFKL